MYQRADESPTLSPALRLGCVEGGPTSRRGTHGADLGCRRTHNAYKQARRARESPLSTTYTGDIGTHLNQGLWAPRASPRRILGGL